MMCLPAFVEAKGRPGYDLSSLFLSLEECRVSDQPPRFQPPPGGSPS